MLGNSSPKNKKGSAAENVPNFISKGTVVVGEITSKGDVKVDGKIIGTVTCDQKLVIGESGSIEGNIDARNAIISGEVKGEVLIRELLQLQQTGKIHGDIYTQKLSVQVGSTFSGNCKMGTAAKNRMQKAPVKVEEVIQREATSFQRDGGRRAKAG